MFFFLFFPNVIRTIASQLPTQNVSYVRPWNIMEDWKLTSMDGFHPSQSNNRRHNVLTEKKLYGGRL